MPKTKLNRRLLLPLLLPLSASAALPLSSFLGGSTHVGGRTTAAHRVTSLNAKRNKRKRVSTGKSKSEAQHSQSQQKSSLATQNTPAKLAGIEEDHRFEQFFYSDAAANQIYQVVDLYDRPLLLCNPTLAVMAEKKSKEYKLLDRDTRFNFLDGFQEFSLTEPHLITDYDFDAVFIDPPFANVTPDQVARCLELIGANQVPLWVAYNSRREEKLLGALNKLDCPDLEPKWQLSYKEGVSSNTQDSIWFYGPVNA
mmetsp:Transcript_6067/g.9931  ORF Transcript_6067/g.9931 Transcript_6067/m.9931 type:complete len:254 (+) Transcript_6067:122-883(+)|eukprot:scaffold4320_cov142-Skeletonema_menzelii.AAC.5